MKKTLLCALCCLMAIFALGACAGKKEPKEPFGIMEPTQALFDGLDQLEAHVEHKPVIGGETSFYIVIDDGAGMKGFASPLCFSYRDVLTSVMNVSVGGKRTYIRASQLTGNANQGTTAGGTFFNDAVQKDFFLEKTNDVAKVIEQMSSRYQKKSNQVWMLISDLMFPTAEACANAVSAMDHAFIQPENATIGVIGVMGDFKGTIMNLPINPSTGQPREIHDYMVKQKDEFGIFSHPLYILFMGNDQGVLRAMEKAVTELKDCQLIDAANENIALFFSEYRLEVRPVKQATVKFHLGNVNIYDQAKYDVQYVVRGIKDEKNTINYEPAIQIPDKYQRILKTIPIRKLYALKRGITEDNVTIYEQIPFKFTDTAESGSITDDNNLLTPAKNLNFDRSDYSVSVDIKTMQYQKQGERAIEPVWVDANPDLVRCEIEPLDFEEGLITIHLSVDTGLINLDEPIFIQVCPHVCVDTRLEEIKDLYQHLNDIGNFKMNQNTFERENALQSDSSARFTIDSTGKTPFLSNLFVSGIANQQVKFVHDSIRDKTSNTMQAAIFGIVIRGTPDEITKWHWPPTKNFGWAFSFNETKDIKIN